LKERFLRHFGKKNIYKILENEVISKKLSRDDIEHILKNHIFTLKSITMKTATEVENEILLEMYLVEEVSKYTEWIDPEDISYFINKINLVNPMIKVNTNELLENNKAKKLIDIIIDFMLIVSVENRETLKGIRKHFLNKLLEYISDNYKDMNINNNVLESILFSKTRKNRILIFLKKELTQKIINKEMTLEELRKNEIFFNNLKILNTKFDSIIEIIDNEKLKAYEINEGLTDEEIEKYKSDTMPILALNEIAKYLSGKKLREINKIIEDRK
jgi:hypothetical protein